MVAAATVVAAVVVVVEGADGIAAVAPVDGGGGSIAAGGGSKAPVPVVLPAAFVAAPAVRVSGFVSAVANTANVSAPPMQSAAMIVGTRMRLRYGFAAGIAPESDIPVDAGLSESRRAWMVGKLDVGRRGGGTLVVPIGRPGSRRTFQSSRRISKADCQRCDLSKASAFAQSISTFAGMPGATRATDRAWRVAAFTRCSDVLSAT